MQKRLLRPASVPTSVKPPADDIGSAAYSRHAQGDPPIVSTGTPQDLQADFGDFRAAGGYPNMLQTTIDWKTSRKMRYEQAGAVSGGFAKDSWIPFSYIVVPKQFQDAANRASNASYVYPDGGGTGEKRTYHDLVGEIKASASMSHWFSDS